MNSPTDDALRLRLLGGAAFSRAGGRWQALSARDALLLARLAMEGAQARSAMAGWLWPGVPAPRAAANLRQRLFRLRRDAGALLADEGERLRLAPGVALDLQADDAAFEQALLAGLDAHDAMADGAIQDWLDEARRRWQALRADRMSGAAARLESAGQLAAALAITERLLILDPLLEHAWRRLIRLHHRRGDRAAAVAAFERCERVLKDALGLRPAPETQGLLAEVERLSAAATPLSPLPAHLHPALRRPPRRIGQHAVWQAMAACWRDGGAFVLEAPAGLGKSRLLEDFVAERPGTVQVAAQPGDEGVPYATLTRLLRQLLQHSPAVAPQPGSNPAERTELARLLPELGPTPSAPGQQALLLLALDALFERATAAGIGFAVDDLHLADSASRQAIGRRLQPRGGCWALTARPAGTAWPEALRRIALQPLTPVEAQALLDSLGAAAAAAMAMVDAARLAAHCDGNPGFMLETLRQLALEPPASSQAALPLPPRMEAAIEQQLQRLSAPVLALLRVVAVANGDSDAALAAQVLDEPLMALAEPWQAAEAAQLIRADAAMPQALRQVVLAKLPLPLRRALHERVAHALDARGAPAVAVARHYAAAGMPLPAAQAARRAADEARRLGRPAERLALLQRAAADFERAEWPQAAFEARLATVPERNAADGPAAAMQVLDQLAPQAITADDRVALALTRAEVAVGSYLPQPALDAAGSALAEARPGGSDELRGRLLQAAARGMLGLFGTDEAEMQALCARIAALDDDLRAATLWSHAALVEHYAGRTGRCVDCLQQQAQAARRAGHVAYEANAEASLAGLQVQGGDSEAAIVSARRAADLLRRLGDEQSARQTELNEAIALIGCDRLQSAMERLDQVAAGAPQHLGGDVARVVHELRAEVWWRCGQFDRARAELGPDPGPELPLPRRLNHGLVALLTLQASGDSAAAGAGWRALRAALPDGGGIGLLLRVRALSSVVVPFAEARCELDRLSRVAAAGGSPPAEGLARLRRAAHLWRAGEREPALDDVQWLLDHASQLRHLYVPGGEWRALAYALLRADGRQAEAEALRAAALEWFEREVRPQLPPGTESGWLAHPAYGTLFADATRAC
ncbi:MAG: BTAD domain-containing putative transcriptional regulator [Betaproteobacteria bacterium]